MLSRIRDNIALRALAFVLAAVLAVSAPLAAADPVAKPTAIDQVQQRFQTNFSEGLAGQAGAMAAIQLGQKMQSAIGPLLGPILGSVMPAGVGSIAGELLGQFATTAVSKLGMDAATALYKKVRGQKSTGIDLGETLAGSLGSTLGTAVFTVALGPTMGRFLGGWLGWNLATTLLGQHRKGKSLSIVGAVKASDIPRLFMEQGALQASSLLAGKILGGAMLAGISATPVGAPLAWLTSMIFSSIGSSLALAIYDTAMERSALATVGPRAPSSTWKMRRPSSRELVNLKSALDRAYDKYVRAQRIKGQFADDTQEAFKGYVVAQRDYEDAQAASLR
ncbi:MAG: hypothetical protein HY303_17065 [Candidatus Wallbacteria bacterium]|nr:hypothetical protein [Candidatus Wallbacteria bacterium]